MGSGKDVSMTRSDPLFSIWAPGRFARAYGVAIVSVTAAALARLAVDPIAHEKGPFVLFVFAVVAASLFGGFRGRFTAVLLSLVALDYLFIDTRSLFATHQGTPFCCSCSARSESPLAGSLSGLTAPPPACVNQRRNSSRRGLCSRRARAKSNVLMNGLKWPPRQQTKRFGN